MSTDQGKPMLRFNGIDFDLTLAPAHLRQRWEVAQTALEIAKGAGVQAIKAEIAKIGREIVKAMTPHMLFKSARRSVGVAGLWAELRK
jgi:hypothetical protein